VSPLTAKVKCPLSWKSDFESFCQPIEGLELTILFGRFVSGVLDKLGHQREGEAIGSEEFGFQDGVVVKGLSIASTRQTMRTVTAVEADCARSIDGHDEVDSQ